MRVIGLDLSLTATGIATDTGTSTITTPKLDGMERLDRLRSLIRVAAQDAHLVIIEGYAYGAGRSGGTTHSHALGELGGVIRLDLYDRGIPHVDIPPATLKKYATGKGNASKAEILAAAIRRLGYPGADHNEADAMWLHAIGRDAYQLGLPHVPLSHRAALDKITWPNLTRP